MTNSQKEPSICITKFTLFSQLNFPYQSNLLHDTIGHYIFNWMQGSGGINRTNPFYIPVYVQWMSTCQKVECDSCLKAHCSQCSLLCRRNVAFFLYIYSVFFLLWCSFCWIMFSIMHT